MNDIGHYFAVAPKGMESLLAAELESFAATEIKLSGAGVAFQGRLETAYRACLWSRIANRILLPLSRQTVTHTEGLYEAVKAVPWQEHFSAGQSFAITFNAATPYLNHSHFGALKAKDAIVDQFRETTGTRPDVDKDQPDILINIYWLKDQLTISLDLSGESLHKRGYRASGMAAPLKENLAAALLLRANWPEISGAGGAFVDPLCGSGTLPIEAAMIAGDIAPGLLRKQFGFLNWKQHDSGLWQKLVDEAQQRRLAGVQKIPAIRGFDRNKKAVHAAQENIRRAGLDNYIHLEKCELADCTPPAKSSPGLIVTNPPYGERLGDENQLGKLYQQLGQVMKTAFPGWRAAVFTSKPELGKQLGLRACKRHSLFNGALKCTLLHFIIEPEWFLRPQRFPRPLGADQRSPQSEMLANRLRKNQKRLNKWLKRESIDCYRLYDHELPDYAFAIDVYHGDKCWVQVQEYEAPASIDKNKALLRVKETLGVVIDIMQIPEDQLFYKLRKQQKGRDQYQKLMTTDAFYPVREGGHRFLVNFTDYLDTGLFLDHRPTRKIIQELAEGKNFLNLFAYTGSVSVYAAKGGARSTTSVDMSATYLDWAQRNFELNGIVGAQHRLIRADCLSWLEKTADHQQFDLIFLDPPSFSNSKRMQHDFDVQRDHVQLIKKTCRLLTPNGVLIFSNNRRNFNMDRDALGEFKIEDISRRTLPEDFRANPKIHNCWKLTR